MLDSPLELQSFAKAFVVHSCIAYSHRVGERLEPRGTESRELILSNRDLSAGGYFGRAAISMVSGASASTSSRYLRILRGSSHTCSIGPPGSSGVSG